MRRRISLLGMVAMIGLSAGLTGCGSDTDRPATSDAGGPITVEQLLADGRFTVIDVDAGIRVRVVLGLYSGVPDPEWTLTTEEANELAAAIAALTRVDESAPAGGLGYHGFTTVTPDGTLLAYAGKVLSADSDPPYVLDDPDRTIERFLLDTARPHVTAAELGVVADALDDE